MNKPKHLATGVLLTGLFSGLLAGQANAQSAVTVADARVFLEAAEKELYEVQDYAGLGWYVKDNFTTADSQRLVNYLLRLSSETSARLAREAAQYNHLKLSDDEIKRFNLLKFSGSPAPFDAKKAAKHRKVAAELKRLFGKGESCQSDNKSCLTLKDINNKMKTSRDSTELLALWQAAQKITKPMQPLYQQQVSLTNQGAQDLGYADTGALWRSQYESHNGQFSQQADAAWNQIKPLYNALQCHVRGKLSEHYGDKIVPADQPIPAHLLGDVTARNWSNIYDIVAPGGQSATQPYDIGTLWTKANRNELDMVHSAEKFWQSMGFDAMPETFYQRSVFTEPEGRKVSCHGDVWWLAPDDLRINFCIKNTETNFKDLHTKFYFLHYNQATNTQPDYYKAAETAYLNGTAGAIRLSMTPGYLKQIGLLDQVEDESKDLGRLMKMALDNVARIPYDLIMEQWRWKVYAGDISEKDYNSSWWALREKYQGIAAPADGDKAGFDPAARFHLGSNRPNTAFFMGNILQFQLHKAMCDAGGNKGPLHRCSIYNNKEAGKRLSAMFALGKSQSSANTLKASTGLTQIDGRGLVEYFAPLKRYLDKQNRGQNCQ